MAEPMYSIAIILNCLPEIQSDRQHSIICVQVLITKTVFTPHVSDVLGVIVCVCVYVCVCGFTQGTLYTTTTVYGVLVHQEGAICTTKA